MADKPEDAPSSMTTQEPKSLPLGLDDLLRHSLSGAFVLLTTYYLCPDVFDPIGLREGKNAPLIIALAFPLGAFVYAIHRAVVHPFFERLLTLMILRCRLRLSTTVELKTWRGISAAPTQAEMFFFWARWDRLKRFPHVHTYMTRAASQMHFLYTIPLAYGVGCLAVRLLGQCSPRWDWGWFSLAFGVFVIALIDNYRLSSIEINRVLALYDGTEGTGDHAMPGGWRRLGLYPQGHLLLDALRGVGRQVARAWRWAKRKLGRS